ncbi:MAG: universal stress protein, partial [Cyanobacteria bacterium J06555_13]
ERLFLLPGNSAKATVQAAIGAIPLAYGLEGGEAILALSALSILVTAPLGAWAIPTFAPRLLERGVVDPTKVAIARRVVLLAAVDATEMAGQVLTKAAALARRCDGEVIVVYAAQEKSSHSIEFLQGEVSQRLADIRHQFLILEGSIPEVILQAAVDCSATDIIVGRCDRFLYSDALSKEMFQVLIENSSLPVTVVGALDRNGLL